MTLQRFNKRSETPECYFSFSHTHDLFIDLVISLSTYFLFLDQTTTLNLFFEIPIFFIYTYMNNCSESPEFSVFYPTNGIDWLIDFQSMRDIFWEIFRAIPTFDRIPELRLLKVGITNQIHSNTSTFTYNWLRIYFQRGMTVDGVLGVNGHRAAVPVPVGRGIVTVSAIPRSQNTEQNSVRFVGE